MSTVIKICGLTRRSDAFQAASLGVDLLGFVFARSPREADPKELCAWLPDLKREYPRVRLVGVFLRPEVEEVEQLAGGLALDLVQIHGWEERREVRLSVDWILATGAGSAPGVFRRWRPESRTRTPDGQGWVRIPWAILVDNSAPDGAGGSGRPFDWAVLEAMDRPPGARLFLAGGLGPDNVAEAIVRVRPFGVDASSPLEAAPGVKDPARVIAFVQAARRADQAATPSPETGGPEGGPG